MKRATVLFLETSLRIGGSEMVLAQLIEYIDRRRFRPVLCCLYEEGALAARVRQAGVPVYHRLAANRWDLRVGIRLLRVFHKERVDVLFLVNGPMTQFWGTWCALLARVPVRISMIGSTGKISRIRRRLLINRLTFRWMTRITAKTPMHRQYLIEQERIPAKKLEIIPNGVDFARFHLDDEPRSLRASLGIVDGQPIVGIVAMLRPEKAHEVFLQAAAYVLAQLPSAHFLIVGEGPERPRLEALARTLGIDRHLSFLGARHDVPALVILFDVAVLSSRPVVETLSNAVLEYMAAGKPVVATRVGSLSEQIDDGKTGFLVEPGDWQAMAQRIVQLLKDRTLAERMGQAGREKVRRQYTIEQMVRQHEALFERLLNHR